MKPFKKMLLTCALGLSGFFAHAQTDSIDISSGRTISGVSQWPSSMDDYWTCLRPGEGYQPVMVGTGLEPITGNYLTGSLGTPQQKLSTHAQILVPYPVTNTADACLDQYYSNVPRSVGDIRHTCGTWTEPIGRYYLRRKVNIDVAPCKRITDAYIRVKLLTGFDYADQVFVNGHPLTIASYNPLPGTANPDYAGSQITIPEYVIPVNPAWLLAGNNNTITVTVNKSSNISGTGFICEAWLVYTLNTGGGPSVNFAGTTSSACVGSNAQVVAQISNTNPGSYTYTATLKGLVSGTTYTNVGSSVTLAQLPVTIQLSPVANTHYKLLVVSNDVSGCSAEVVVPLATNCHARFNPSITLSGNNITVQAIPTDREESTHPGFQQTWTLEDLDPASLEPVYVVNDPACWHLDGGEAINFEGFDPVNNDYEDEYQTNQTVVINCPGGAGLFKPHHLYRLTRSVKSASFDWESFSTIIQPGANPEFTYNLPFVTTGKYNLEASTANEEQEAMMVGFEQKWLLEKIEPGSNKILYAIESPACWNGAANTTTVFEGFEPIANDYELAYMSGPITVSCVNANAGVFEEGHNYRLTRFVKGESYDWTGFTAAIVPGSSFAKTGNMPVVDPLNSFNTPADGSTMKKAAGSANTFSIYPNPGTGQFTITTAGAGTIDVYDIAGRQIRQVNVNDGAVLYHLDLSGLPKGMYSVKVTSGTNIITKKLIME